MNKVYVHYCHVLSMAPYTPFNTTHSPWHPEQYDRPYVVKLINGLPRYGYSRDISLALSSGFKKNDYLMGIVISSCCLLVILLLWCLAVFLLKIYSSSWASGCMERPQLPLPQVSSLNNEEVLDDDTSSTSASSQSRGSDGSGLTIDSSIFWTNNTGQDVLTMAVIAREQKRDQLLHKSQKKFPQNYSTTTNGHLTLVTMVDLQRSDQHSDSHPQFRLYIPPSLRLPLLRTYHDCLIHPDDMSNASTMIYDFFTWEDIRRDVYKYVKRYRECMKRVGNAAMVMYQDNGDAEGNTDENAPITLDVIASEQAGDSELAHMMMKAPSVFSTATNGSIQLITARGKDKKYRIVIPKSLQAKVLQTYHDCLVNPTKENNFKRVLYIHFTWNGIHKDVEEYVLNEGLTDEMKMRSVKKTKNVDGCGRLPIHDVSEYQFDAADDVSQDCSDSTLRYAQLSDFENCNRPIGLDEIAKEQKKDKELRHLKKEEPFVFSTVRYGNTLLTTAQNFRDNKYRIVIPRQLQGRMLKTYQECLLSPTPDRNFDTLLYNHFTWNGIHDDVDYFVKNGGQLPKKDYGAGLQKETKAYTPFGAILNRKNSGERSSTGDVVYSDWVDGNDKFEQKMTIVRILFLASGIFTVISSILFVEHGVNEILRSLNGAQLGLQRAEGVASSALSMTNYYLEIQSDILDTAKSIGTFNSSQWCTPAHPESPIHDFVLLMHNSTYTIGVLLRDIAIRTELEVELMKHDLNQLVSVVQNIDATLEDFKTYIDVARVLVIFIDIIVISLMIACILAWVGEQHFISSCVRKTFIIPLLVALLILFWIFSAAVLMGATVGADFCNIPDESTTALITGFQEQLSPFFFMLLIYFVTGCLPERQPIMLETLSSAISSTGAVIHSQLTTFDEYSHQSGLTEHCGGQGGPSKLVGLLDLTDTAVHGMYDILLVLKDFLQCNNFNPIYTTLVYNDLCNSGVAGLSWVFFTSLSVAFFSITMVTLRAALRPD